jgi:copper chaperone
MSTTTYGVTGMTCGHCVAAVTEEVGKVAGVKDVTVELVNGGESKVTVASDGEVNVDDVRTAVDEAGYVLTGPSA